MRRRWHWQWSAQVLAYLSFAWVICLLLPLAAMWHEPPFWAFAIWGWPAVPWLVCGAYLLARTMIQNPPIRREWESVEDIREHYYYRRDE